MQILMNYGKTGLPIDFPDDWDITVIKKKPMPVLFDPEDAMNKALSNPVNSGYLGAEAIGCHTACILICDITRPVPNSDVLPVVIRELLSAGLKFENITILIATGLHRPNEGDELRELVGDKWVLDNVRVLNHYARNDEDHKSLGTTKRGIPVKIDRRFVDADLRIVTGLVEPHFMAGYSGGRKLILPGIAHAETIMRFHSAGMLEDPNAANCVLNGNPLHEEQLQVAEMLGDVLAVNVVIDDRRRLSFVNYGEIKASHLEAVKHLDKYAQVPIDRKFNTVVTSAAGYPLDKTYYQTIKGMVAAMDILVPGGDMFIVSECSEGMGSPEFVEAQTRLSALGAEEFLKSLLSKSSASIDEWQTEMLLKALKNGNIHIHTTGLSKSDLALTGIANVDSLDAAIKASVERSADKSIAVIPEGPYVIPTHTA